MVWKPRFLRWISYSLLFEVASTLGICIVFAQAAASERTNHQQHTTFGLDSWQMQNKIYVISAMQAHCPRLRK
jgi:hypothetical protein